MAFGDKYATLQELKDRLEITSTAKDAQLTAALETATDGINSITGRQFNTNNAVSTRKYRPTNLYKLDVDDFVDNTGLVVVVNNVTWTEGIQFELEPLNNVVDGVPGWPFYQIRAIFGANYFPVIPGQANVSVTANWGWAAIPNQVHEATLIAAEELSKMKDVPFGIGGYGDFGIIKVRDNPFVCRLVKQYIRYPILVA